MRIRNIPVIAGVLVGYLLAAASARAAPSESTEPFAPVSDGARKGSTRTFATMIVCLTLLAGVTGTAGPVFASDVVELDAHMRHILDFGQPKLNDPSAKARAGVRLRHPCNDDCVYTTRTGFEVWDYEGIVAEKTIQLRRGRFPTPLPFGIRPTSSGEQVKSLMRKVTTIQPYDSGTRENDRFIEYMWLHDDSREWLDFEFNKHGRLVRIQASVDTDRD